jgi:hypothetical protein
LERSHLWTHRSFLFLHVSPNSLDERKAWIIRKCSSTNPSISFINGGLFNFWFLKIHFISTRIFSPQQIHFLSFSMSFSLIPGVNLLSPEGNSQTGTNLPLDLAPPSILCHQKLFYHWHRIDSTRNHGSTIPKWKNIILNVTTNK